METLQTLKRHHLFFNVVLPGKADEPLDGPLTSQILAHFTSHNLVLPSDPNPGSGDIHFHQQPWVLMQPKLRKATLIWSIEPHPNMNANTFTHTNLVRMTSKFKNPERGSKTMMVILGIFYHLFSFLRLANRLSSAPRYSHVSGILQPSWIGEGGSASALDQHHPCFAQRITAGIPHSGRSQHSPACLTNLCPGAEAVDTPTNEV